MSATLILLLASSLLAQVSRENRYLRLDSASYDAEKACFIAEGRVSGLPEGTTLAASVGLPDVPPLWIRGKPDRGAFRLEVSTEGREVLPARYAVRVSVRPEDQDPSAAPLPNGLGEVGLDVQVGTPDEAKQARARLVKEDLATLEELRRLHLSLGESARGARAAQSLASLKAKAFPEGELWRHFVELREAQGSRDTKLFLHPVPAQQQAIAQAFGTWEKWFLAVWEETAKEVRAPVPDEILELGAGGQLDRRQVEAELRDVAEAAYEALAARPVEWRSGLPGPFPNPKGR